MLLTELDDFTEGGNCVIEPFPLLKRDSTLANHPAALSAQVKA
jgi:hypothetical protein